MDVPRAQDRTSQDSLLCLSHITACDCVLCLLPVSWDVQRLVRLLSTFGSIQVANRYPGMVSEAVASSTRTRTLATTQRLLFTLPSQPFRSSPVPSATGSESRPLCH